ncbi:Hypothetical_protein [Hexamita inflata]|uniref:Hypothetical_protein n=1 Tax=Hexamita inflata TaxID=28002 RepID=A0AA86QF62_9EUKA|nr:Hypothetical protein HINF_LOCUS38253 [Hexamita inflata]CAI9952007.1 Hypothetical protein HINF_LOCUS39652 [Hexamita inflata]
MLGYHTELKQLIQSTNGSIHENITVLQKNMIQQFQLVSEQNLMSQAIITSFKSETTNNFSSISTQIYNNQLNIMNNFTYINSHIKDLNASMKLNYDQVTFNTNANIKNNFTQTNQKIDLINTQIDALVTNNQFQTQINLLKQQIQNISVSISQSMTGDQYRCIMIGAAVSGSFNWNDYVFYMTKFGCEVKVWW